MRKSGGAFGGATLSISKAFPMGLPAIVATQDQCLLSLRASSEEECLLSFLVIAHIVEHLVVHVIQ